MSKEAIDNFQFDDAKLTGIDCVHIFLLLFAKHIQSFLLVIYDSNMYRRPSDVILAIDPAYTKLPEFLFYFHQVASFCSGM